MTVPRLTGLEIVVLIVLCVTVVFLAVEMVL